MSRHNRRNWTRTIDRSDRQWAKLRPARRSFLLKRRLWFEPLEDRRLLTIAVDTLADGIGIPGTSLREAIIVAAPGETINFSVTGTINLTNLGGLVINKNLTINGPGANLLTINAFDPTPASNNGDGSRIFNVDDGTANVRIVSISGLKLAGGDVTGSGGAIRSAETLTLGSSLVTGNSSTSRGGGLYSLSSNLNLVDTVVTGNSTMTSGGGIHGNGGAITLTRSKVSGNQSASDAGGVDIHLGTLTVTNSTIANNTSVRYGGGVWSYNSTFILTGSTISGNHVGGSRGLRWLRRRHPANLRQHTDDVEHD